MSLHLASKLKHLDSLQFKQESALPGADIEHIDAEIEVAKYNARALEAIVEEKEKEAQAADGADEIADNADFVPLDEPVTSSNIRSWPEDNYEDFATKCAAVSDSMIPVSKLPSTSLFVKQKTPAGSKTLMPHPLELFTAAEIDSITPKSIKSRWCNFYEDPVEPAKCWMQEEFQALYEKPGFHFMVARVAQVGTQFRDSKLSSLKSRLAERWKVDVVFQCMRPRMDWMMATILAITDVTKEILLTSLIHLQEGNAVYVVCHFAAPAKIRELEITIANTITEPGSLFNKLKKRCLEFEKSNVQLGWWVAGVRTSNAPAKYRATFYLDSISEYWTWFHDWSHLHGSTPESIPLLNFDPAWKARKPYVCQICYNSDHHLIECPLPHVKIGGIPLVSAVSCGLVANRKPAERQGWEDDLLNMVKGGSEDKQDGKDLDTCPDPADPPANEVADAVMDSADDSLPMAEDDGLAAAKAQYNDPFSQLKSMFPYLKDDTISGALLGNTLEGAIVHLTSTLPVPPTPVRQPSGSGCPLTPAPPIRVPQASGSGLHTIFDAPALPSMTNHESTTDFIFSKLSRVFNRTGNFPCSDMISLLASNNGDLSLTVDTLQSAGLKFSWPSHVMATDWRDWADASVTPQAATPISTAMSAFTILADPLPAPTISYDKEASFLQHMFTVAGIIKPVDVDFLVLSSTYRGQFPAVLQKLRLSHGMVFPMHWNEAFMMRSFSEWFFPSTSLPAATGQTPAPVISQSPMIHVGSQRMCALQHP